MGEQPVWVDSLHCFGANLKSCRMAWFSKDHMAKDGELARILTDLQDAVRSLGQLCWIVAGFGAILTWYVYFRYVRRAFGRALSRVVGIMATFDLLVLSVEKLADVHEEIHKTNRPLSPVHQWLDHVAIQLQQLLQRSSIYVHLSHFLGEHIHLILFVSSGATVFLAYILFRHHHRIMRLMEQHEMFLDSVRGIMAEATRLVVSAVEPKEATDFIEGALQALVETTLKMKSGDKPRLRSIRSATLFKTEGPENERSVLTPQRQWPTAVRNFSEVGIPIQSAEGKALEQPRRGDPSSGNGLIYIPWMCFPHGTRHLVYQKKPRVEYVRQAFRARDAEGGPKLRSLLCREISVPDGLGSKYVLSLGSNRWICFREVDFHTIELIGDMIGIVITELYYKGPVAN
jgi:hypothetical protein